MITTRSCLLVKVNNHRHQFNGTICAKPTQWRCGASENFRQNSCAAGKAHCFDMYLFDPQETHFRKRADQFDRDGYLTDLANACGQGQNPLVFFFTNPQPGKNLLVGLYVVGEVRESEDFLPLEYTMRPVPGRALSFGDLNMDNGFLWRHAIGTETWCRQVSESYVPAALAEILRQHQQVLEEAQRSPEKSGQVRTVEANIMALKEIILQMGQSPDAGDAEVRPPAADVAVKTTAGSTATGGTSATVTRGAAGARDKAAAERPATEAAAARRKGSPARQKHLERELKGVLGKVREHTRSLGLYYPDDLLKRYHISLATKPFVIFAGVSGGGKTQLACAYAQAAGGDLLVVSVGPDWTSSESLLGAYDVLSKHFVPTPFAEFLRRAAHEWSDAVSASREPRKFFAVLDEMNLSHVEYYFSDFLSQMELPPDQRHVVLHNYDRDGGFPRDLTIPPNFYVTGTVNVDETTHRFSPKVLDRANFIRLDDINMQAMIDLVDQWRPAVYDKKQARAITAHLRSINTVLSTALQHFGYRTAREIIAWVDRATGSGGFTMEEALDIQIMQKVLVKVQGSRFNPTERKMIRDLETFFEDTADPNTQEPLFPRSAAQVKRMSRAMDEEEFTFGQQ